MYMEQPKKMLIINILDILKKYTDADHRLSQKEITEILAKEYSMKADRKAIKRNLMNLLDFGYDISYSESIRTGKNGDEETIYTDWYMRHTFEDSELRLLIDSVLFSKHIPYKYRKDLIKKIEGLSNIYFKAKVKHICTIPENFYANKDLFYTIDILDKAINKGKKVRFEYCSYGMDKKMHSRKSKDGTIKKYIVNPYQMAAMNGRYYIICNYEKYDDISNYRIDRIKNIELMDTPIKPFKSANGIDLQKYMAEHIYMFSGESIHVKFRTKQYIINDIIDYFGVEAKLSEINESDILVTVKVNEDDMVKWAMQYCDNVEIIEPISLRNKVVEGLKVSLKMYGE